MAKSTFWEEYAVGATRITYGRTITETDLVIHAGHTGDFMPNHMDAKWCKTQWFGQRLAHGNLVFCIAVGMSAGKSTRQPFPMVTTGSVLSGRSLSATPSARG